MHVLALAVISLDGFLTRKGENGVSFASPEDQAHFRATLSSCDAAVMGRATFSVERDRLVRATNGPLRVVLTRSPETFAGDRRPGVLEFTASSPRDILASLEARGYQRVAILGGGQIYSLFQADGLLDELLVTVEPRLLGAGTPLLARPADERLRLTEHRLLNESTLLLRYLPVRD